MDGSCIVLCNRKYVTAIPKPSNLVENEEFNPLTFLMFLSGQTEGKSISLTRKSKCPKVWQEMFGP